MRRVVLTVAVASLLFVPEAHAGFLVGASAGQAGAELEDATSSIEYDEDAAGFSVRVGYRFFKFFGVEAGYVDFGKPEGEVGGGVDLESDSSGFSLFAVGTIPITRLELFGKVGYFDWDLDGELSNGQSIEEGGSDFSYGAGIGVHVLGPFYVRAEYEVFKIDVEDADDSELSMISVGADWRF